MIADLFKDIKLMIFLDKNGFQVLGKRMKKQNDHQEIDQNEEPLNEEETSNLYWEGENFEDLQYKEDGCPWLYTESWNYD